MLGSRSIFGFRKWMVADPLNPLNKIEKEQTREARVHPIPTADVAEVTKAHPNAEIVNSISEHIRGQKPVEHIAVDYSGQLAE
jgi:hypothetical protein